MSCNYADYYLDTISGRNLVKDDYIPFLYTRSANLSTVWIKERSKEAVLYEFYEDALRTRFPGLEFGDELEITNWRSEAAQKLINDILHQGIAPVPDVTFNFHVAMKWNLKMEHKRPYKGSEEWFTSIPHAGSLHKFDSLVDNKFPYYVSAYLARYVPINNLNLSYYRFSVEKFPDVVILAKNPADAEDTFGAVNKHDSSIISFIENVQEFISKNKYKIVGVISVITLIYVASFYWYKNKWSSKAKREDKKKNKKKNELSDDEVHEGRDVGTKGTRMAASQAKWNEYSTQQKLRERDDLRNQKYGIKDRIDQLRYYGTPDDADALNWNVDQLKSVNNRLGQLKVEIQDIYDGKYDGAFKPSHKKQTRMNTAKALPNSQKPRKQRGETGEAQYLVAHAEIEIPSSETTSCHTIDPPKMDPSKVKTKTFADVNVTEKEKVKTEEPPRRLENKDNVRDKKTGPLKPGTKNNLPTCKKCNGQLTKMLSCNKCKICRCGKKFENKEDWKWRECQNCANKQECVHPPDCPFGLKTDAYTCCQKKCGGQHCTHWSDCKPLEAVKANLPGVNTKKPKAVPRVIHEAIVVKDDNAQAVTKQVPDDGSIARIPLYIIAKDGNGIDTYAFNGFSSIAKTPNGVTVMITNTHILTEGEYCYVKHNGMFKKIRFPYKYLPDFSVIPFKDTGLSVKGKVLNIGVYSNQTQFKLYTGNVKNPEQFLSVQCSEINIYEEGEHRWIDHKSDTLPGQCGSPYVSGNEILALHQRTDFKYNTGLFIPSTIFSDF